MFDEKEYLQALLTEKGQECVYGRALVNAAKHYAMVFQQPAQPFW